MDDRKDRKGKLLLGRPFTRRRILQGSLMSGAAVAGASLLPAMPRQAQADTPKKGGNLRVAILGGSNADTLDAHSEVTQPDSARVMSLYEGLVRIDPDGQADQCAGRNRWRPMRRRRNGRSGCARASSSITANH